MSAGALTDGIGATHVPGGAAIAIAMIMDILEILDRCAALEREAGVIYAELAERCRDDDALCALWYTMAAAEREHARKLSTWRTLIAAEPAEHRPTVSGFADALRALEAVMRDAHARAKDCATTDGAFAIALELETSELDALYATLLQGSPIARYPDIAETLRRETRGEHHGALARMVRERSRDEQNLLRASILAAHDAEAVA